MSSAPISGSQLWYSLRELVEPISFEKHLKPYLRVSNINSATKAASAAQQVGAETTVKEHPSDRVKIADTPDEFFDSYSLIQRVDVVNEDVLPFVPYVQPLSLRQFQLIEYGMLLSGTERTILMLYSFMPPIERRVRAGTSAIKSETYGIDIKHTVPKRALLPGEELEADDENPSRARYGDDQNSDSNQRERIYHAFLLRIAEDTKDHSAMIVPEFRLTFVNRGKDNTHLGASYVCTGCYASANTYFDVHSDLREERDYYTQLPYYSRFTADKFAPLAHREALFATWKRLTGGSVLADGTLYPQIGHDHDSLPPVCGYSVEDYTIENELKEASKQYADKADQDNKKTDDYEKQNLVSVKTVRPPSSSTFNGMSYSASRSASNNNNKNNKSTRNSRSINPNNNADLTGVANYLKSVDVSGTARHMNDHSVVMDDEVCDAVAVTAGAVPIPEVRPTSTGDFIVRRCTYSIDRMAQRVIVAERRRGPAWRDSWEATCKSLGLTDDFTRNPEGRVTASRIVLRDTRSGENILEDGEISAYVPSDAEASLRAVYNDEAEEQLRLWITKALISAEAYGIHLVLLPIDTEMILARCIGLLFDNDGGYQRRSDEDAQPSTDVDALERERARRRILRIIMDAVEEFVQFSGIVWRVIVYANTETNGLPSSQLASGGNPTLLDDLRDASDFTIARNMLSQIQIAKFSQEENTAHSGTVRPATGSRAVRASRYGANNGDIDAIIAAQKEQEDARNPRTIRGKFGTDPRLGVTSPLRQIRPEVVSSVTLIPAITESPARVREGKGSSITSRSAASQQRSMNATSDARGLTSSRGVDVNGAADGSVYNDGTSPRRLAEFGTRSEEVRSATLHGLYLDEASQRELFNRMDVDHSGTVSLDEIKNVLLKKTQKYDKTVLTSRGTIAGRAVHEGAYSSGSVLSPIDDCGVPNGEKAIEQFLARKCKQYGNKMTFEEFSVMLLELARR